MITEGKVPTPKKTIYRQIRLFVDQWKPSRFPMKMNAVISDFYKFNPEGPVYVNPDELFDVLKHAGYSVNEDTGVVISSSETRI